MKIFTYITLMVFTFQVFAKLDVEIKPDTFESKIVKSVIYDSYNQFNVNNSRKFFLNDTHKKESFLESLSKDSYQGAIKFNKEYEYKYIIEKNIIYWDSVKKLGKKSKNNGEINITDFYKNHVGSANSVKLAPLVWVGIIFAANCTTSIALCNIRCNNCVYGAKTCSSSCFTNSCSVQCNDSPVNGVFPLFQPWSDFEDTLVWTIDP